MQLIAEGHTDVGRKRSNNEDYFIVDPQLGLYVVCDGMGGHASGEVASKTAGDAIRAYIAAKQAELAAFDGSEQACAVAAGVLRDAIEHASTTVFKKGKAEPKLHGMGTTCVALMFLGDKVVMGHVGDSRIYLVRNGVLHQLSEDHTYANDAIKHGMMTPEQAYASKFAEMITRAVGVQETVVVDTFAFDVTLGDTFLLCSDGLYGYFEQGDELQRLLESPQVGGLPGHLVGLANERGGKDNVTALVVRAELPQEPQAAARDQQRKTMVDDDLSILRHLDLFVELTMAELVRVLVSFRGRDFSPGTNVTVEGESGESMFVIVRGEVKVTKGGAEITTLLTGQHFGEMSLLDHKPRSATVTAATPVRALELTRASFSDLMLKEPSLGSKILYKLAQILSLRLDAAISNGDVSPPTKPRKGRATLDISIASPFARAAQASRRPGKG